MLRRGSYQEKLDSIVREEDDPYTFGTGLSITQAHSVPDIEYPRDIYKSISLLVGF